MFWVFFYSGKRLRLRLWVTLQFPEKGTRRCVDGALGTLLRDCVSSTYVN